MDKDQHRDVFIPQCDRKPDPGFSALEVAWARGGRRDTLITPTQASGVSAVPSLPLLQPGTISMEGVLRRRHPFGVPCNNIWS